MSAGNPMSIFLMFVFIFIIAFFAIGFVDSVQAPTDATALAQYNNLTQTTDIASAGIEGTLLLLIFALVVGSVLFIAKFIK